MGRRVLTVSEMSFHRKYARNRQTFAPADLDGEDLIEVFGAWVVGLGSADTRDDLRQNWVQVVSVSQYASRVLVLQLSVGSYGEAGPIVETGTGQTVFEMAEDHAPTGENRAVLMVPETGEFAYFLAEESSRGSAGGRILRLFKQHFSAYTDKVTMETHTVTESEAWSQGAELKEVEVRVQGRSEDIADGPRVDVGVLSHVARPRRRSVFPRDLLGSLRKSKSTAGQIVGISEVPADAEVFVTMERLGRTKKFAIGGEGAPAIREILNDATEPPLDLASLVNTCAEKVSDLAARSGGTWDSRWSTPQGG